MSGADRDQTFEHEFDGIREYDNPLPGWWVLLFWGTIVFSILYATYYHFGNGPSIFAEYDADMLAIAELQSKEALSAGPITDATLLGLAKNDGMMLGARQLFASKCAVCHGAAAEGKIGPNLTDDFWLHGSRPTQIHHTIAEGVTEKGMIAWKTQLRPGEIAALAAYVVTLHGTNPPNPRPPQGEQAPSPVDAAQAEPTPVAAAPKGSVPTGSPAAVAAPASTPPTAPTAH